MRRAVIVFFCVITQMLCGDIHVLYTSALITQDFEKRKQEYLHSLNLLKCYGFDPWVVEATNIHTSFFDEISGKVLYPQVHNNTYRNKGCNELLSMRAVIPYVPFKDDDVVVKMTGRYFFYKPDFFKTILRNPSYDAYVKQAPPEHCPQHKQVFFYEDNSIFTGCFAMKWKYFKEMLISLDECLLEQEMKNIETAVAEFIEEKQLKTLRVEKIFMIAKIFGMGNELWKL